MTIFSMIRDINGYNGFGLPFAYDNEQTTLASNVEQHFTIPANYEYWIAVFSVEPGSNVFIANNATAEVPGSSFAATASQLLPQARLVKGGDVLSFITPDTAAYVGVSLYAIS